MEEIKPKEIYYVSEKDWKFREKAREKIGKENWKLMKETTMQLKEIVEQGGIVQAMKSMIEQTKDAFIAAILAEFNPLFQEVLPAVQFFLTDTLAKYMDLFEVIGGTLGEVLSTELPGGGTVGDLLGQVVYWIARVSQFMDPMYLGGIIAKAIKECKDLFIDFFKRFRPRSFFEDIRDFLNPFD